MEQLKNATHLNSENGNLPNTCTCRRAYEGTCLPSYNIPGELDCIYCFRLKSFIMFHEGRNKMKYLMKLQDDTADDSMDEDCNRWSIRVKIGDEKMLMTDIEVYKAAENPDPQHLAFMTNPLSSDIRSAILMANRLWDPLPHTFLTYHEYHQAVSNVAKGIVNAFNR